MGRNLHFAALASVTALMAGCASGPSRPAPATTAGNVVLPQAQVTGALLGHSAAMLLSMFGQPALDVREGSARKLQFLGQSCILDAYLYPRGRSEAAVTHVDARLPDGRDTDRAACIASLRRR